MVNKPILEVRARGLGHIIDDVAPAEVLHIPNLNMPVKTGVIFMLTFGGKDLQASLGGSVK